MYRHNIAQSKIPQPADSRYPNQVELCVEFTGFPNPVEDKPDLLGPDPDAPWPPGRDNKERPGRYE